MASTHAIVHFLEDNTVAVVPVSWFSEDRTQCYFPPNGAKGVNKMIQRSKDFKSSWSQYQCRVMKLYENYEEARADLAMSEVTSDLSGLDHSTKTKPVNTPKLPVHPASSTSNGTVPPVVDTQSELTTENTCLVLSEPIPLSANFVELVPVGENAAQGNCGSNCAAKHQAALLKLQNIENMLETQAEILNAILSALSSSEAENGTDGNYKFPADLFPIKKTVHLRALEELLYDTANAQIELKLKLKPYCGGTLEDTVKSIFKFCINDEVLSEHSLKGQSKKSSFSGYKTLYDIIFGAISMTPKFKGVTINQYDDAIAKNLKRAADRFSIKKKSGGGTSADSGRKENQNELIV